MAEVMQQTEAKIGVKLTVNRVRADGYWSKHWMKHPLGFGSINPRPSEDVLFTQFFKSDAPWNESGGKNPRFHQLLLSARAATAEPRRKQRYCERQGLGTNDGGIDLAAVTAQ